MTQVTDANRVRGWIVIVYGEAPGYRDWIVTPDDGPVFRSKQAAIRAQHTHGGEVRQAELLVMAHD